jgi:hypothetical protein
MMADSTAIVRSIADVRTSIEIQNENSKHGNAMDVQEDIDLTSQPGHPAHIQEFTLYANIPGAEGGTLHSMKV